MPSPNLSIFLAQNGEIRSSTREKCGYNQNCFISVTELFLWQQNNPSIKKFSVAFDPGTAYLHEVKF